MMLGSEQLATALRFGTVVVPLAMYFFVLGYLNTRSRPQCLTGRQDSALLVITLSPLALLPLVQFLGGGLLGLAVAAGLLGGAIWLLAPKTSSWVIYNLSPSQGRDLLLTICRQIDPAAELADHHTLRLPGRKATLDLSVFPVLRNLTVRLDAGDQTIAAELDSRLAARLGTIQTEPVPMAVTLLLLATAMLVAPLAVIAPHSQEIVRILTDLLP
jgi:hypothetical protein